MFDWGTYNALNTLTKAAVLGMRLTEIPPRDFSRKTRGLDYFEAYRDFATKAFTTIIAHGPYYNLVSDHPEIAKRILKAMRAAVKKAAMAGASIFNVHLGWRVFMDDRDLEAVADMVKKMLEVAPENMYISLETTYTRRQIGSLDEIKSIIEMVGSDRVIPSVQLENMFMYETRIDQHGNFIQADKQVNKDFWLNVLRKTLEISKGYLSLRFSQVTGVYFGRRLLKKRTPLGKGYPSIQPLAEALAQFMVREVRDKGLSLKMHIIYTGPPETKYEDTIDLYASIMRRVVQYI
ncbi:Xylose isomerase domain protein TIM barrel [Staphylothermus hellenicus DSM 12710]|uniref:Xylose isomerase domain protein TIM barrel n=1 Tax=Staphylothermus hellenicus (strain DSM 12710 / JCM 10830 / BK20S6-10-b1 / P8) TaxID=591019 RepID=D7DBD8_STAHD|nr:Xylose isomerase domain protein TIM barrel [Staphylothermus hellenicus DSM 12710]